MQFDLIYPDTQTSVGSIELDVADVPVVYDAATQYITATFDKADMTVKDDDAFAALIKDLMVTASKEVTMEGLAAPTIITNMGELQVSKRAPREYATHI